MIKELKGLKNYVDKNNKKYSEYINQIIKAAEKKKQAVYTAAFLTPTAIAELDRWWGSLGNAYLDKKIRHHMTIKYYGYKRGASPEAADEVLSLPIGEVVSLTVVGYAKDDKGQAVLVSGVESSNPHPHITLSTAEGVNAVYSNDLLKSGVTEVPDPSDPDAEPGPTLEVKIGFYDGKDVRYSLDGSIYDTLNEQISED